MRFEFRNALRDLDRRTPAYFLQEIFSHGSLKVKIHALEVLEDLDADEKTTTALREILRITPD